MENENDDEPKREKKRTVLQRWREFKANIRSLAAGEQ